MIRAASRSDLPQMQNLIDIGQNLLGALQVLVNVEKSAQEDNNISMLELEILIMYNYKQI